jgi:hypothetical protein
MITVHLALLLCNRALITELNGLVPRALGRLLQLFSWRILLMLGRHACVLCRARRRPHSNGCRSTSGPVANPALGFREDRPYELLYSCSGNLAGFSRQGRGIINKISLRGTVTGNFGSLISRKNSLFFSSLDGSLSLAKCSELCGMSSGAVR